MNNIFREIKTKLYLSRDSNINFAPHIHDDIELVYVVRGSGSAFCDGKHYTLSDGSLFLVFPEQIHSYSDCTDGEYILLVINPSRLLYLEEFFRTMIPVSALGTATPALARLLSEALEEFQNCADSCVVDGYLTAFFGKLCQSIPMQTSPVSNDTVSQILQYCSHHFRDEISARDLCDRLHISPSYISHLFRNRLKISFPEYMNALRLNKALPLLREPGLNMTTVAERAGFPTIRTFNRAFRKKHGMSPLAYRKTLKA